MRSSILLFAALALSATSLALPAEESAPAPPAPAKEEKPAKAEPAPANPAAKITTHTVKLPNGELKYTAEAGTLPLLKADGAPRAKVFYIAYTLDGQADPAVRPVTFCFNGGPGSSSVWLHLGAFGPRRIVMPGDGTSAPKPPFQLADNAQTLLATSDLVFIDPVSTGYSRAEKPDEAKQFYGIREDGESVAEFIRLYTARHQRWASPKYLAGESYGVVRACFVANLLQQKHSIYPSGLVLVSGLLDFATLQPKGQNDLPYLTFLPAFTATAWHHKKLSPEWQADRAKALQAAHDYATNVYPGVLLAGASLNDAQKAEAAQKLAQLTGLPAELIASARLRISPELFRKKLLADKGQILGRFDGRTLTDSAEPLGNYPETDPSFDNVIGAFGSAINDYLRRELQYESDLPYEVLTSVNPWNMGAENAYAEVADELEEALQTNRHLRALFMCGQLDLATPAAGITHSLNHLRLPPGARERLQVEPYESGHMMYLNPPDLEKMQRDLEAFYRK